jgi:N-acetylmuramoyl-L-alanine amidase
MTRETLLQQINLKEEMISLNRLNRPGVIIKPSKVTIHNTSNTDEGANATMHSKFVRNTGYYITKNPTSGEEKKNWVSWHFTVDDKMAIKHLPLNEKAFHAGTNANETSVAIEICMYKGISQEEANERAARLTALLCFDLLIPLGNIVTHNYWTGKNCPELLLTTWKPFLDRIDSYLKELKLAGATEFVAHKNNSEAFSVPTSEPSLCWTTTSNPVTKSKAEKSIEFSNFVHEGFNENFLSSSKVTLPVLANSESHLFIEHQNMRIYFNKHRKLALYSACNYNKDALFEEVKRSDSFRDDGLILSSFQLGKGFYSSPTLDMSTSQNCFDRGHLIARRYNQWGESVEEAKRGERDTYFHTNIHPQVKELNQVEWKELENFIIDKGQLDVRMVSILAGSLLRPDDPIATYLDSFYKVNKTVQIPIVYWKVVYYEVGGQLRKIAFLMSQRNRLKEISFVKFKNALVDKTLAMEAPDPFSEIGDPLKTYIVKSSLIELATGLDFTSAQELYDKQEPLEVVIADNETSPQMLKAKGSLIDFI